MRQLGEIHKVKARDIWPDEESDFTPWLHDNLPELSEKIGLQLDPVGREVTVGRFSADLVANDRISGRQVIIENQYGESNHDHLGKVLTYAADQDAGVMIWIAEEFCEEHLQALDWLNQRTVGGLAFFAIQVEVFQIDGSAPAPHFQVVVKPRGWRGAEAPLSDRERMYQTFFSLLLEELKRDPPGFTTAVKPGGANSFSIPAGKKGLYWQAWFSKGQGFAVLLLIDTLDEDKNKAIYDTLYAQRESIEQKLEGLDVKWERRDDVQYSLVAVYRSGAIDDGPEELAALRDWAVATMIRFRDAFSDSISQL